MVITKEDYCNAGIVIQCVTNLVPGSEMVCNITVDRENFIAKNS